MEIRTHLPAPDRAGYVIGLLLFVSGLAHVAILVTSGGSWEGPLSLRKPATFGLSFGSTLVTIVWVTRLLALSKRARVLLIASFAAASVLETALVTLQAWRGVPSHFNVETAFDTMVTRGLAGGGIALVAMVVWLTAVSFRANREVAASVRIAVRAGFLALCGAMVVGAVMIGRGMTLVFGGHADAAYRAGGSLKPMHAVLMHGVLVLPGLAWWAGYAGWSEREQVRLITVAVSGYALTAALVTIGTLMGVL